ncbi:MAG: hypothetical protein CL583_07505 [Alteromonadaceae bacterium]|uniref:TadE/TadG family type IV pilus assembly protein n=1 Tax=Marinobacter shengliensis TaxID=1389223 RepID=UPI000C0B65B7|nr:hypothetical protein [Alteromonadaceae bacterium]|tara:strand:- start:6464 stop:6988 length:525 start_codon:yes stop_codon:yes gene_type:complete
MGCVAVVRPRSGYQAAQLAPSRNFGLEIMRSYSSKGVITLEFVLIFPILVGLIYGAAGYGVLFFNKSQMQTAVDRAAAAVFALDRRASGNFAQDATSYSNEVLVVLSERLPKASAQRIVQRECVVNTENGLDLLECTLRADAGDAPFLPQVNVFGLGAFPPLPASLTTRSVVAF